MSFKLYLEQCQQRVEQSLQLHLSATQPAASRLLQAMQYSVLNGGKRVRPVLVYATAEACHASQRAADYAAVAVEMIHSYSLVHDDLPAMDNDELRRGKPTCHIAFDEASAILAGDALQSKAFQVLSQGKELSPQQKVTMIQLLASGSGVDGMAGGQSIDLEAVDLESNGRHVDLAYLENMHNHKTGALIKASVLMGAHCQPDISAGRLAALATYADAIGLAFQVQDDILDVISDTQTLGKQQGADAALNKPTYVSLLGLEGAQKKASELHHLALDALAPFESQATRLRELADYIIERRH